MKHTITLALIAFAFSAKAQVAEIVSSGGGAHSASSISIDFTVGDIAVESFDQGSLRLFEGFQAVNYGLGLITGLQPEVMFSFYPNPTQKFLTIEADFSPGSRFRVTDLSGKILELPAELTPHKAVVDVSSLPSSLYLLTIQETTGISRTVKFIKAL
jgi:hypothetical protein